MIKMIKITDCNGQEVVEVQMAPPAVLHWIKDYAMACRDYHVVSLQPQDNPKAFKIVFTSARALFLKKMFKATLKKSCKKVKTLNVNKHTKTHHKKFKLQF